MRIEFTVAGEPKGKQRPKFARTRSGGVKTYTPDQTVMYENFVKFSYIEQVGMVMLSAPIRAVIKGVFPIPKSTSKKKQAEMLKGSLLHTKKIDCDNLAKVILDSLNKVAYADDAGVAELEVRKVYGEVPRVEVILEEIGLGGSKSEKFIDS